ncbi:MAG TPA: hypothetical protein VHK47_20675 [Polyangia bacterium]|nr:hypothetical protein [Polyangia bacterium]
MHDGLEDPRVDDDEGEPPIVVHLHVHRGDDGQVVVNTAAPAAPRRRPAPPARPALTGKLFSWKEHYDLVAKRHVEAGLSPPSLWEALRATWHPGSKRSRRG